MRYTIIFTPESEADLERIYEYIADKGFPDNALRFTESIVRFCGSLAMAPKRGAPRPGVLPGLRILGFHRSVAIIFQVRDKEKEVRIARILHGGQDAGKALNKLRGTR